MFCHLKNLLRPATIIMTSIFFLFAFGYVLYDEAQAYVSGEPAKIIGHETKRAATNLTLGGDASTWQELEDTKIESLHHQAEVGALTARIQELEAEKVELKGQLVVRTQNCVQLLTNEWEYSQQVLSDCLSEHTYNCTKHVQYPRLPIHPDVASEYFIQELETEDGIQLDTVPPQHSEGIEEKGLHMTL